MKRIICLMMALLMMMPSIPVHAESISGTPYNEENYDVTVAHVMINQIYAGGYCDYSFIELYNPTEQDIDLSSWSLHYIPSIEGGDSVFYKLDLTGTISAHCSYLVRCNKTSKVSGGITLNNYDQEWDQVIYTKGCSVVLMSNQEELETTEVFNGIPLVEGYVDMLGMSGNDGIDEQKAICFESEAPVIQSKKKGIRRDHFIDCDDNANDTMIADYSFGSQAYIDYIRPRSSAEGVWEDGNMPTYTVSFDSQGGSEIASQIHVYYTAVNQPENPVKEGYIFSGWYHGETEYNFETLPETDLVLTAKWETEEVNRTKAEITALKAKVPKYLSYYTSASANALNTALSKVNSTDLSAASQAKINELYDEFETALNNLQYKTSDVPVVYVTTNDEVGANLQKADGYVYTDLAIVDTKGKVTEENDKAQIKVRGNSTANAPKKPYNVKFSSKQNVLGMGKAKKWTLLANAYDVTLLRNYLGLDIGQHLGLDYTSEHEMVDVYVDGVLKGSYLLAESVEAGSSRVDIEY